MKLPFWGQPPDQNCFDDSIYWEVRNPVPHKYDLQVSDCQAQVAEARCLFELLTEMDGAHISG